MTIEPDITGQRAMAIRLVQIACGLMRRGNLTPESELRVRRQFAYALRRGDEMGFTNDLKMAALAYGVELQ
jgi:hypothetical protein